MGARAKTPPKKKKAAAKKKPVAKAQIKAVAKPKPDVTDLLTRSLQAHEQAKAARAAGDDTAALAFTQTAYDLRVHAHRLDPKHSAPIWTAQQDRTAPNEDTHASLMAFYQQQLGL